MVELRALAHERSCEAELAQCLVEDLDAQRLPDIARLRQRFAPALQSLPVVTVKLGSLDDYDALLMSAGVAA
jgi:plasmid stability protein